ncbi:ribosomal protein S6 kinase delta-1 isoform X2 [Alligator mississippiensis]|uniref:Ribosomal protein S6 kinase delta-1 n=1 Tax=Alligator mississippiensis TaxID=8496 RepID=A0A151P3J1_ALLMI|nr:ribosomal protein S6 kinase delta-1 isoform X2 [Alligator mississippiensis]KYO43616.1 ribosomal protein S6 kinase delta-1 isoform A [Alligator mississippiensis]
MLCPRERPGELARFYTVSEPRRHPRGHTVYKVTARIVSRRNPEDVQEIVVWKRYSDFKKLHKDLWQIHKNLYRHTELFPPFAKAIVFGRFDETVIEERRQCAEDLLQFSANIPALYNSKQFEDFFKGGEVHDGSELIGPVEPLSDSLIDSLSDCSSEVRKDLSGLDDVTLTSQSECGGFSSDSDLISLTVDVDSLPELDDGMASDQNSPSRAFGLGFPSEALAQSSVASEHEWSKPEGERENRSLFTGSVKPKAGKQDYLEKAGELIKLALKKEEEEDYEAAFGFYRKGVDLLLEGVQGESSPTRREAVKRKTAEYLMRAEKISTLYQKSSTEDGSLSVPLGSLSSRPSWNLRSPAEELKAFRVLGVIDKVLLVMDTRTQETLILKGLRKSSEYSRNRKTIIPRCVPNMVCLHKYIISEESVFLVLQHAEGGKLWSYISKFLNRSPEESFEIPELKRSSSTKIYLQQPSPSPKEISSSVCSGASDGENMLKVIPLKSSLTPSSQDDSSNQEDGQESSPKWMDSGSSSEEECTSSYLTLCNEYGQEKIDPSSLNEEPVLKIEGGGLNTKDLECLQANTVVGNDSFSSQVMSQEVKIFTEDADPEIISPTRISDSLNRSKNSPMELFRIDSKDSTSELLGLDFGDKLFSLKSEPLKPFFSVPDRDRSLDAIESRVGFRAHDTISRGSNDSVPVISFKDAAVDDVSSVDEGRPDLLINLPGMSEQTEAAAEVRPTKFTKTDIDILESKLLETPDVLQLNNTTEQCKTFDHKLNHEVPELGHSSRKESEGHCVVTQEVKTLFRSDFDLGSSEDVAQFQGLGANSSTSLNAANTEESFLFISNPLSGAKEHSIDGDAVEGEAVLLFSDQTEDFGNEDANPVLLPKVESEETASKDKSERATEGEMEIHQIFQDLDNRLALTSRFHIPEDCIQRWAAEMVVALDALHRQGIVCRDLNPNNILLNDRGHIQLTYFSRWSEVEDSCDNDAIERMYCAPEVGAILEETEACDWWSLGAILFELLTGKTLVECHPAGINTHTSLNVPDHISEEARSLIQQLLQFNPVERLGAGAAGAEDIKSHPFFAPVNWADLVG